MEGRGRAGWTFQAEGAGEGKQRQENTGTLLEILRSQLVSAEDWGGVGFESSVSFIALPPGRSH